MDLHIKIEISGSKRKIPNTKPFDDLTKFASLNSAVEKG